MDPPSATWAGRLASLEATVEAMAATQQEILETLAALPRPPEKRPPNDKAPPTK